MEQDFETQVKQFIELLNSSKPEEYLSDCISAAIPHSKDLDRIFGAKAYGKLPEPVINVLINYVILKKDVLVLNKIFNDIAFEWSRKDIKTVEEAMLLAKQENKKYEKWIEKYDDDSWLGDVLRGAIISGMTDKELGQYVRQLQEKYL
ncbi:DnaD domain protein [Bacillus cereus]|uniref:DnaD domain protein n=1 Tax=Bacillus cereus group TaxID=86661 RepID=UPI0024076C56|nr:DnaD domain protein [Bacillus cereus]MDF9530615.1 DnaD domain protein [Bacillus cereus]MDG1578889.1 DnaD domain protein [Bacillus cereus]